MKEVIELLTSRIAHLRTVEPSNANTYGLRTHHQIEEVKFLLNLVEMLAEYKKEREEEG